ncbi:hypothetical protein SKAU_G00355310 [Synaphobranchus kaupii]|uniref:Uncharacterized protein n=1 Tax=Synaphobranchus kaupii TaxID=118154 RepID=A0A9Q1IFK2_SYNKA|nr:hypothetical protein SKAU_G00355310 [Synaphobranchus kaupii]
MWSLNGAWLYTLNTDCVNYIIVEDENDVLVVLAFRAWEKCSEGAVGAGAYPSMHWVSGRNTPPRGQVANPSQGWRGCDSQCF